MAKASDPHTDVTGALHDVSNALTVLLGWVAEARAPGATAESVAHALVLVDQEARVARDLARRAIGASPVIPLGDDLLESVLKRAVDALFIEAHRAGVRLTRTGRAGSARVPAGTDVGQVVTNLVLNALAHAPRGTAVTLDVAVAAGIVTIDVKDEGPGVAEARRARIFEGDSTRAGGAGVGLRHSRALAVAAGGDLELVPGAAQADPRGARFRLTWPRADAMTIPPPSVRNVAVLEGTRVLIVEDDEQVTLLLETALGARGAVVTVARDRAELTKAIAAGPHDAALIDLSPIADDVEGAIAAMKKRSPAASLVFISGSAVGLPHALSEGVQWVRKPFEVSELIAAVLSARKREP